MVTIRRRSLLAAGGGGIAAAALAACGTEAEEPSRERDAELLSAAVAAEGTLAETYGFAADTTTGSGEAAVRAFARASERRHGELSDLLDQQGGSADEVEPSPPTGAESGVGAAIVALESTIAVYRQAAGLLSEPGQRRTAMAFLGEDAAELAVMRGLRGEDEAPEPFVTGSEERPLVAPGPVEEDDE